MPLPPKTVAVIDARKITHYLLSPIHPTGRAKATYFGSFGFKAESWQTLQSALVEHLLAAVLVETVMTEFGEKYIVEGSLKTPDGRHPRVRAVWFVETGETVSRFVTAYPAPGDRVD